MKSIVLTYLLQFKSISVAENQELFPNFGVVFQENQLLYTEPWILLLSFLQNLLILNTESSIIFRIGIKQESITKFFNLEIKDIEKFNQELSKYSFGVMSCIRAESGEYPLLTLG